MIPIAEPYLNGNEKKYVLQCLETNWISSQGDFILRLEEGLAAYHGVKYGVVTSSCTTAIHLALKAFNIGPGDEVICPDLTFIAPANMVVLSGAALVLIDVDPQTLSIDVNKLADKITCKTKAIIVVHQFGHAAPMDEILAIARGHDIKIIEDNAESIGGRYKGRLLGTFGNISCFSFFANKIITSGEGGALLTNDEELADRCRELRDHGMSKIKKYHHINLGYNYRMTNIQAAIGLAQLEQLDTILTTRMEQMCLYYKLLNDIPGISLRRFADWCEPVHWLMTMTIDDYYNRDEFLQFMRCEGVDCRQMINPVHRALHFIDKYDESDYPNSTRISAQSLHLPCSTSLQKNQVEFIVEKVKKYFCC
ncbi:MAG: DegT/DnrJ/EryC1/StrS family aminotransferase [Candidatus Levybacteria bacterium]|nr:DegT/DnrJ/EryC1/StrS family aminotransferase [Candidatus Levybacteria bacterium]